MMKKPKTAIVPFSEIAKSPRLRLYAGYYLGVDEERKWEKAVAYTKRMLPSTARRLWKTGKALFLARLRVLKWRLEGRIKYK